jgi:hypothetical protein
LVPVRIVEAAARRATACADGAFELELPGGWRLREGARRCQPPCKPANGIAHANGVADSQDRDPDDMARPLRLRTSGASEDFDSGLYAFDGAGNVTKMGSDRFLYDLLSRVGEAQVEVPGTGCGQELVLDSGTDTGTITHQSCGTVRAEGSYRVGTTGNVTLRAGNRVVLGDGFSVASGGRLTVGTDPALDPEGEPTDASQSFSYDRFGNLLSVTTEREGESSQTRTIGTNASTNRLTVASYDLSGNVTTWAGLEYRHDPFNLLWQTKPTGGNGHTFLYGPGDERLWTIDWTAGTAASSWVSTWTLRDLDGSPLRQYRNIGENLSGNWFFHCDYVYRNGGLLAAHTPEGLGTSTSTTWARRGSSPRPTARPSPSTSTSPSARRRPTPARTPRL